MAYPDNPRRRVRIQRCEVLSDNLKDQGRRIPPPVVSPHGECPAVTVPSEVEAVADAVPVRCATQVMPSARLHDCDQHDACHELDTRLNFCNARIGPGPSRRMSARERESVNLAGRVRSRSADKRVKWTVRGCAHRHAFRNREHIVLCCAVEIQDKDGRRCSVSILPPRHGMVDFKVAEIRWAK